MRRVLVDQLVFIETDLPAESGALLSVFKDLKSIGHVCFSSTSWCKIYEKKKSYFRTFLVKTEADSLQPPPVFITLYKRSRQYGKIELNTARNAGTYFNA